MTSTAHLPRNLILALPRLRPAFLPGSVTGIWPGLPDPPAGSWQANWPWSPAQARACLADHEAAPALPAQSWLARSLQSAGGPDQLRPDEEAALAAFAHDPGLKAAAVQDSHDEAELKPEQAQSALILAWLQEGRVLDMARLRHSLAEAEAKQKTLFSGEEPEPALQEPLPDINPDEASLLPPWLYVLRAAAVFLPPACELYCADSALALALLQGSPSPGESSLPGCRALSAPLPGVPAGKGGSPHLWHIPLHFIPEA